MTKRASIASKPNGEVPASGDNLGQDLLDNHSGSAEANGQGATPALETNECMPPVHDSLQPSRNGHWLRDTHRDTVDLDELHELMGHYARLYWDIQKTRISTNNRIKQTERDGLGPEWMNTARDALISEEKAEHACHRQLERLASQHFMADWIAATPGVGLAGFAGLMGATGSLDRFATVSKLWKYLGLHVTPEGNAPKRSAGLWSHTDCQFRHMQRCKPGCTTNHHPNCTPGGVGNAFSPHGRVIAIQIADSMIRLTGKHSESCAENCAKEHKRCPYRDDYDRMKTKYEAERADWTQGHRHNAAMRYAVKCFLRDLWIAWHRRRPSGRVIPNVALPADDQRTIARVEPLHFVSADLVPV